MNPTPLHISQFEFEVLNFFEAVKETDAHKNSVFHEHKRGWFSNVEIREFLGSPSLSTRTALGALASYGLVTENTAAGFRQYRITPVGMDRLKSGFLAVDADSASSYTWTGVVDPVQAERALAIISELEDACERMTNNSDRAQVMGLVRALEILLTIPEPPRAGIVALIRDPAFANIVQLATFLAALAAAIKP